MSTNFLNLKKKLLLISALKSFFWGLSLGASAGLLVALIQRVAYGSENTLLCVLIGLGVMLLSGGTAMLTDLPTERNVARKIDKGLSLNEKAQTLVAFKDESGTIIEMQRESTQAALAGASLGKILGRKFLWNLIAPVITIAMIVLVIVIPPKEIIDEPDGLPPIVDPEFDATKIQIQELEDLIKYVKDSNMENEPRELTVAQLETLLAVLKSEEEITVSQMKEKVLAVILEVEKILDDANSNDDIAYEVNNVELLRLASLAVAIRDLNGISAGVILDAIRQEMPDSITKKELKEISEGYAQGIKLALANSQAKSSDVLYLAMLQLGNKLEDVSGSIDSKPMSDIQTDIKISFEDAKINISTAFNIQLGNYEVKETVVKTLIDIFGLPLGEIPKYEDEDFFVPVEQPDEKPPESTGNSGGAGDGEMQYGSKDKIYDPETGNFVEYGTIIGLYLAEVTEQIQDGKLPVSLEDFINDYFATLYGGEKK